jgi:hypothetical protein
MKRGAALASVLLALALLNALVVGAMYVARRESAAARLDAMTLQPLAEGALVRALVAWDSLERMRQPVGISVVDVASSVTGATVWVTRTAPSVYWLVAESRGGARPEMSRRIGLIVSWNGGVPAPVFPRAWAELP